MDSLDVPLASTLCRDDIHSGHTGVSMHLDVEGLWVTVALQLNRVQRDSEL